MRCYSLALTAICAGCLLIPGTARSQPALANQLAELVALKDKVGHSETRIRVEATHRVWAIGLESPDLQVKMSALGLLAEPVRSSSDHIRMPAVYAIADIANSCDDSSVKIRALATLAEPLQAGQVPIRDVAIDAVNSIARAGDHQIAYAAVSALAPVVRSGNNGVRIPAINALVRAVEHSADHRAQQAALELLSAPLDSDAVIGGMEVRMMAVAAVERIGMGTAEVGTKAKAMGMLQAYGSKSDWEPEARRRAQNAATHVQATVK